MKIGANYSGDNKCVFTVWAPLHKECVLIIVSFPEKEYKMDKKESGYFQIELEDIPPGTKYFYAINNRPFPDPASNYQPDGVHGPSEVIDHTAYEWKNEAAPIDLKDLIIYEMHIGVFTPEGTFKAAIEKLDHLKNLGVTAVEIMPVAQYPGSRNWGYDGVSPFAPQNSYGRPEDMKQFIDKCHEVNLNVVLDVVYNHFGPEGNYMNNFGPYFTPAYRTPWGDAINFDHAFSDEVRNYFFQNAFYWLEKFNIDGLRLDAIDQIYDKGTKHFLAELSEKIDEVNTDGKRKFIIAESDLNDVKVIKSLNNCGYGCDAQWSDDFHHSIHSLLTGEKGGYYIDYGSVSHVVSAIKNSFVFSGNYSEYRKKNHGSSAAEQPASQFVVCLQNHDQVGNRAYGKRLSNLINFEGLKSAAGILLLSPYIPLIFMGEEYGEMNPFQYFISHEDENLVRAVQAGRRNEFNSFQWKDDIPDPFSTETFERSKLNWNLVQKEKHSILFEFYRELISCRKNKTALQSVDRNNLKVSGDDEKKILFLHRWNEGDEIYVIFNFNHEAVTSLVNVPEGNWMKILDSASEKWLGPGTSTPDNLISREQNITIKGLSLSMYETKDKL